MSLPAWSDAGADDASASPIPAEILTLPKRPVASSRRLGESVRGVAGHLLPPVVTIGVLLLLWQGLSGDSNAGLPSPTSIWRDSRELILHPFFDRGGVDKGLFWHALTSLQRVAAICAPAAPSARSRW